MMSRVLPLTPPMIPIMRSFLTAEFIESTTAQGCFIVLQCEYGNPDVFRALLLPDDSSTSVQSTIHDVVSSTYNMFVYDLEEDELPNSHPAVEQNTTVTFMGTSPIADGESQFLNNGSVYWNGVVTVNVTCEFKEGIEGASCVLVYREYGNKTLVVEEYPQNTVFPVTLTVDDNLEKYTFAIFGKDGSSFDERPIIAGRVDVTETTTPTISVSTSSDGSTSSIAIGVPVTAVLCIIITLVILAVITLIWWKKSHKSGYSSSDVVHSCFCCPSPSETNDLELFSHASVRSGSRLISDDGGTKPKKDGHAEGEAKPPFSGNSFHIRQDSGVSMSTPPVMSKQKGIYTDVDLSTSGVQPEDTRVQYQEIAIRATHKMPRSQYAEVGPLPTNRPKPAKIETKTQGLYVDVLPHATTPVKENDNRGPPTVESVMSLLWGVAGRWKEIAEGLEFDEDLIDEIDTNNDMNEGCLQVFVEIWVTRLQPSWEKLSRVLRDLGEEELARQALSGSDNCQLQTMSRQISSSSSSGIVNESQPESLSSSSGDSEVVTGAQGNTSPLTDSNNDGSRRVEKLMVDEDPKPVVHPSPTLSGDKKVDYCCGDVEEDACVVGLNLSSPGDTSLSVTEDFNIQQIDGFRQMSVARSEPTSKPTEPQPDSSHPGCGGSCEVVNGVERAILPFDDKDSENRGARAQSKWIFNLPYLNNFTVQGGRV
ncbi:hypothetical protein GBAR_LOCUS25541 [Geodia barretti]|uniref:Death domain-containing protein n=1 Tax=Geodia barretti TaxID=519541 RepID=A0AA35TDA8_GEOBA|nr:hypothetical protein GBAR_LOCUS25541 [Geodia barretti]